MLGAKFTIDVVLVDASSCRGCPCHIYETRPAFMDGCGMKYTIIQGKRPPGCKAHDRKMRPEPFEGELLESYQERLGQWHSNAP